jgi:uncharacterized protein (DUF1330 family)
MNKGYWIVRVDVSDPHAYANYVAANGKAFAKFGARFLVRGGDFEVVEGEARARNVVIEYPCYEAALACYHSSEYVEAMAHRENAAVADVIVIDGYDGAQPGEVSGT